MVQAGQQDLKCIMFTKFKGVIMLEKNEIITAIKNLEREKILCKKQ